MPEIHFIDYNLIVKIGLITVNYNNQKDTQEFISSLRENRVDFPLFISDLSDKSPLRIKKDWKDVVVQRFENRGYAFGVNRGLEYFYEQDFDGFVVVNNDILFSKNFRGEVFTSFSKFAAFTGKIYYAKGFEYHKGYKKGDLGKVIWFAGGRIDWRNIYVFHRGVDEVDKGQYDNLEETEFITGCLFAFSRRVFERVGHWDEKFFLYWEDVDYSVRVKRAGFFLIYNPYLVIYHKNAQSTRGPGSKIHTYHQRKGRLRFALKYAPFRTKLHVVKNYLLGK